MENSNLHLKIREERIKQGLSQKELGEMVGLPQQAINRIEQGQRKLDVELFEKLCQVLKIKKIGSFSVNFISSYYHTEPIDISEYEQNQEQETVAVQLKDILGAYNRLNNAGRKEAVKRVDELTEIPRYTKPDESPKD